MPYSRTNPIQGLLINMSIRITERTVNLYVRHTPPIKEVQDLSYLVGIDDKACSVRSADNS